MKNSWAKKINNKVRSNIDESAMMRKKALQEKFLNACLTTSDVEDILIKEKSNRKIIAAKSIKDDNYNDVNLKNEIERIKKENLKNRADILLLQKNNKKIRNEKYELSLMCKDKENEILRLNRIIESLKHDNLMLVEDIEDKICQINRINDYEKKVSIDRYKKENEVLKDTNNELHEEIKKLKTTIENYQLLRGEKIESDVIKDLKAKLKHKDNEIKGYKRLYTDTLTSLNELNNKLYNKHFDYIEKKDKFLKKSYDSAYSISKDSIDPIEDKSIFGFLSISQSGSLVFIDICGKRHDVLEGKLTFNRLKKSLGMPMKAYMCGNRLVQIDEIYFTINTVVKPKKINLKSFKRVNKNKPKVIKEFSGEKILLIASRNKAKYRDYLEKTGLNVECLDSYSENERRIKDIAPSCDVVVFCTSHSSHAAFYTMKSLSDYNAINKKYQLLGLDNIENILARIRYALS